VSYTVWVDGNIEVPDEHFETIEAADSRAIEHHNWIGSDPNFTCGGYSQIKIVVSRNGKEIHHYGY
jgi:hypothetical protein